MADWYGIAIGIGITVRVGTAGAIQTKYDIEDVEEAWVDRTSGVSNDLLAIAFNGVTFVAVGINGACVSSDDGEVWTVRTLNNPAERFNDIATGANVFMTVGTNGVIEQSQEGIGWIVIASGTNEDLWGIDIAGGHYTIVGDNNTILTGEVTSTNKDIKLYESIGNQSTLDNNGVLNHIITDGVITDERTTRIRNFFDALGYSIAGEDINVLSTFVHEKNGADPQSGEVRSLDITLLETIAAYQGTLDGRETGSATGEPIFDIVSEDVGTWEPGKQDKLIGQHSFSEGIGNHDHPFDSWERLIDSLGLNDAILFGWHAALQDDAAFSDDTVGPLINIIFQPTIDEVFSTVNSSLTLYALFHESISEQVANDETLSYNGIFNALIQDGLGVGLKLVFDGEEYVAWVVNARTGAHSDYQNWNFNSMAKIGEKYYGMKADGIYLMEGDTDAGTDIDWVIKTGLTKLGSSRIKKVPRAFIGIRSDGCILLKIATDQQRERWYKLDNLEDFLTSRQVKLGRGVKGLYWKFALESINGSSLEYDKIDLLPLVLSRRTGGR